MFIPIRSRKKSVHCEQKHWNKSKTNMKVRKGLQSEKESEKSRILANLLSYLSRAMAGKLRMVTEQKTLCRNLAILQKSTV